MRIVIDIDGDQVRVHRVIGDELPPAEILRQAAGLNAESAGVAMTAGGVAALDAVRAGPSDAGRAPSPKGPETKIAKSATRRRTVPRSRSKSTQSRRRP